MIYKIYNSLVYSEFDLSLLGVTPIKPLKDKKIEIKISKVIKKNLENKFIDNHTSVNMDFGHYFRKDLAYFEFHKGKEIKVFPLTSVIDEDFIRVLLNYPLGCSFLQKGDFILHASAVLYKNKTFIFPGETLSGKSTIAAYLIYMGGRLITEDTAVIRLHKNKAIILPSYPMIKISDEARESFNIGKNNGIKFTKEKNNRKGYLLEENEFENEQKEIDFCIFPKWKNEKSLLIIDSKREALSNLYRSSLSIYPLNSDKEVDLFKKNIQFLKSVKSFSFLRRKSFNTLEELEENISKLY